MLACVPPQRQEEIKDLMEFDVVVTTYEMLSAEANFFKRRFLWQLVIVDEGHRLKNDKSQLSQKLKQVRPLSVYGWLHPCSRWKMSYDAKSSYVAS